MEEPEKEAPRDSVVDVTFRSGPFAEVSLDNTARSKMIARIKAAVVSGDDDETVIEELGLTEEQFLLLKQDYYRRYSNEVESKLHAEHVYIDWLVAQRSLVRELNDLIKGQQISVQTQEQVAPVGVGGEPLHPPVPSRVALVDLDPKVRLGAIKMKSEIFDKVVERGQSLGLIRKAIDVGSLGRLVSDLSDRDFMQMLVKEMNEFQRIMQVFGTTDIFGRPVDGSGARSDAA